MSHSSFSETHLFPPDAAWWRILGLVCTTGKWTRDDNMRLREIRGASYSFTCVNVDKQIENLRKRQQAPIRSGVPDPGRATDYWNELLANNGKGSWSGAIASLKKKEETKQATVILTQLKRTSPCLVALDLKIRDGRLLTTAFFRSQDVWRRQPANMAFLYEVARNAASETGSEACGVLVHVASAHVYECDLDDALRHWSSLGPDWSPSLSDRAPVVGVIGRERLKYENLDDHHPLVAAREAGFRLAAAGLTVVTGGLGGIMAAASEGVQMAGGTSVGIIPLLSGDDSNSRWVNPYQSILIRTHLEQRARIPIIVDSSDLLLVINGGGGTRIEAERALANGIPVVAIAGTGGVADELAANVRVD